MVAKVAANSFRQLRAAELARKAAASAVTAAGQKQRADGPEAGPANKPLSDV